MALTGAIIEAALAAWLKEGTGLATIRWERQKAAQPPEGTDYATLSVTSYAGLGATPAESNRVDVSQPNGRQLVTTSRMPGLLSVRAQVYTGATVGDGSAFWLLTRAEGELDRTSINDRLQVAGLGLAGRGSVQNLGALVNTRDQGRAALDVRFNVTGVVTDWGTWIERVLVTATVR